MIFGEIKDLAMKILHEMSGGDAVVRGLIMVWFLSAATFLAKSIPSKLKGFFINNFTVTTFLASGNDVKSVEFYRAYEEFLIKENWFAVRNRATTVSDLDLSKGLGDGKHLLFIRGRLITAHKARSKDQRGNIDEVITLRTLGRDSSVFDFISKECTVKDERRYFWEITSWNGGFSKTCVINESPKLFLNEEVHAQLTKCLDDFVKNREWYRKNGKPYRLNIILYGPPGTGKTELTRFISNYLNCDLYNMSPYDMGQSSLRSIAKSIKSDRLGVIGIEDFESIALSRTFKNKQRVLASLRDNNKQEELEELKKTDKDMVTLENIRYSNSDISEFLNALQGLRVIENIIIVMTTNHIELIDEAVTRGSRCNLKLYVGHLGLEQVKAKFEHQFDKPFPNYIQQIKPIKACDLDVISSRNAFDDDGFISELIKEYGVFDEEPIQETVS